MLNQLGDALQFAGQFLASGDVATGLTVTVDIDRLNTDGTTSTVITGGSATHVRNGWYFYHLSGSSTGTEGWYIAAFKTTGTADQKVVCAAHGVNKAGVENLDATISSRLSSAGYTTPPTATQVADAIWDETGTDHVAAGSMGLLESRLDASVASRLPTSSYTAPDNSTISATKTVVDAIKVVTDTLSGLTNASITAAVWAAGTRTLTAATNLTTAIKDAIWGSVVVGGGYAPETAGGVLGALNGREIQVFSPLTIAYDLIIHQGSNYEDDRQIPIPDVSSIVSAEDLPTGDLELRYVDRKTSGAEGALLGTVALSGTTPILSMTSAESGALTPANDRYDYELVFKYPAPSTETVTLVDGTITVKRKITVTP